MTSPIRYILSTIYIYTKGCLHYGACDHAFLHLAWWICVAMVCLERSHLPPVFILFLPRPPNFVATIHNKPRTHPFPSLSPQAHTRARRGGTTRPTCSRRRRPQDAHQGKKAAACQGRHSPSPPLGLPTSRETYQKGKHRLQDATSTRRSEKPSVQCKSAPHLPLDRRSHHGRQRRRRPPLSLPATVAYWQQQHHPRPISLRTSDLLLPPSRIPPLLLPAAVLLSHFHAYAA